MISFSPGPSQVFPQLPKYFQEAFDKDILSANHRSRTFMNMYQEVIQLFKEKLHMPDDYQLLFTSSATENWEIISQSLTIKGTFHLYSGAFGKKWFDYAKHIHKSTEGIKFDPEQGIEPFKVDIPLDTDIVCLTQNETSNASEVNMETLTEIREKAANKLLAVDATSSMGGIELDFSLADIWFASVQKCFGLPAGLGVLILSPKAVQKAEQIGEIGRYNSLNFMLENARQYQTHYTPNVLAIYLLQRSLQDREEIQFIDRKLRGRMQELENIVASKDKFRYLNKFPEQRSRTVLGISGTESMISEIKAAAEKQGLVMGSGYGSLKNISFRIANFPAIDDEQFEKLKGFLKEF
ncbi:aminotransferase class V-fold PLP-dependent enzyme [Litoribacter ruber]|uniref:aminotransferase class V-fold PLP-dependent enzyme n=1 Tax=Litoribacter ruber TaxID=702568 RepID=UPI001BDAAB35|nr:aminotransferase class V-fold PLP-dependent enzyme [Litoribacter ruber]MBT0812813.1 aminotransferase class V-fold PLP-dependent enzyme [Litoribacter ruber]